MLTAKGRPKPCYQHLKKHQALINITLVEAKILDGKIFNCKKKLENNLIHPLIRYPVLKYYYDTWYRFWFKWLLQLFAISEIDKLRWFLRNIKANVASDKSRWLKNMVTILRLLLATTFLFTCRTTQCPERRRRMRCVESNDACVDAYLGSRVVPVDNFLFHSDRVANAWKIQK